MPRPSTGSSLKTAAKRVMTGMRGMSPIGANPSFMDTDFANKLLGTYGLQLPDEEQLASTQNILFPSSGLFGSPRLGRGIENALIAAASMGPPGATTGENISNMARGILGVPQFREQQMMKAYTTPFGMASQMQQLGMQQAQQDYLGSSAEEQRANAANLYAQPGIRNTLAEIQRQRDIDTLTWHREKIAADEREANLRSDVRTLTDANKNNQWNLLAWSKGFNPQTHEKLPSNNPNVVYAQAVMAGYKDLGIDLAGGKSGAGTQGRLNALKNNPDALTPAADYEAEKAKMWYSNIEKTDYPDWSGRDPKKSAKENRAAWAAEKKRAEEIYRVYKPQMHGDFAEYLDKALKGNQSQSPSGTPSPMNYLQQNSPKVPSTGIPSTLFEPGGAAALGNFFMDPRLTGYLTGITGQGNTIGR